MIFDRLKNIGRSYVNDWLNLEKEDFDFRRESGRKREFDFDFETEDPFDEPVEPMFNSKEKEYYKTLEIKEGAGFEEIKASYRKLMKKYHPDRFPNDPDRHKAAVELTQRINVAYTYFKKKHES
ncbi:MAG: J domain-containing protein [Bacteroidota bacterium]